MKNTINIDTVMDMTTAFEKRLRAEYINNEQVDYIMKQLYRAMAETCLDELKKLFC